MFTNGISAMITGRLRMFRFWIGIILSISYVVYSDDHIWNAIQLGSKLSASSNNIWVSHQGTFAMGFYPAVDKADVYSVGIWFHSVPVQSRTVIWTAGEGLKVGLNASLELTMDGDLVLFNPDEVSVWRSNTSHSGVVGAVLRDNGNLALSDNKHRIVWESFETPDDTLVPGQRLSVGQMLRAASKNSVSSYYSLAMELSGDLILKWETSVKYWASETGSLPSDSKPKAAIFAGNGVFGLFDGRGKMVWTRYSNDYTNTEVVLRFLRLDVDGNLRMYSWIEKLNSWISGWQAVENQCDVFATCGVYGVCSFNSSGTVCKCPFEDGAYVDMDSTVSVPSKGCRPAQLGGCTKGATMLNLKRTFLYGIYPPHDISTNKSSEQCKEDCLNDNLCVAATVINDGSGECRLKRTGFISGYTFDSVPAMSFLKMCLVPEAVSNPHKVIQQPSSVVPFRSSSNHSDVVFKVCRLCLMSASLGTVGVFLAIEFGIGLYIYKRRKLRRNVSSDKQPLLNLSSGALTRLSYPEIEDLTKNFGQKLGSSIFKGVLPDKKTVVIKQLNVEVGEKQFRMAVSVLGSIHHKNLVSLQGFCCDSKHRLLIYEHINNGSLDQWLFEENMKPARRFTWQRRLGIATSIARAIAYLHSECRECICHGNLKLENVLLDDDFTPKVSDFGLEKLRISLKPYSNPKGSNSCSEPTPERDVFCFGHMLLEIISGRRDPPGPEEDNKLSAWAYREYESGHVENILDSRMERNVEWNDLERALRIAFWCLHEQESLRPSMNEVAKVLDGTLQVDPPPPIPQPSQLGACPKPNMPMERSSDKYLELSTISCGAMTSGESASL